MTKEMKKHYFKARNVFKEHNDAQINHQESGHVIINLSILSMLNLLEYRGGMNFEGLICFLLGFFGLN